MINIDPHLSLYLLLEQVLGIVYILSVTTYEDFYRPSSRTCSYLADRTILGSGL